MLNRVKLLVKIIEIVSLLSSFRSFRLLEALTLRLAATGESPPPSFLLFNVPFPLTHEPLKVNIKCILPVAFLVFSLLQSIFFNRRIRKPFPPRFFFHDSNSVCFLLPEKFKSFMYLSSRNIRVYRAGCVSYSSPANRLFLEVHRTRSRIYLSVVSLGSSHIVFIISTLSCYFVFSAPWSFFLTPTHS